MQEERPTHTLPSFTTYVNKVFHLREALPSLRDARQDPEIPPATVFEALFYAFVFRLRSFKELEADLLSPSSNIALTPHARFVTTRCATAWLVLLWSHWKICW